MDRVSCLSLCCHAVIFVSVLGLSLAASDTLSSADSLKVGQTLVSSGNVLVLGFFSPGSSKKWFLGMWYRAAPETVVWVANRENPLHDPNGVLRLAPDGGTNLLLLNRSSSVVWSTHSSSVLRSPVAQLLDSGNLVIRESTSGSSVDDFAWQSFDYPSDTLLAGMKFGRDLRNGFEWFLTSWKSVDDPSPDDHTVRCKIRGLPQFVISNGSLEYRTGPWNGIGFNGVGRPSLSTGWNPTFVCNETHVYFEFYNTDSIVTIVSLDFSGLARVLVRANGSSGWHLKYTTRDDPCDNYGQCGPNGFCNIAINPRCQCLQGYVPKSYQEWEMLNHSSGCVRKVQSNCSVGAEGFLEVSDAKLPDLIDFWLDKNMNLEECKTKCLNNCSCTAYANSDVRNGGSGCLMWFGDLIDVKGFKADDYNQILYLRVSASELDSFKNSAAKKRTIMFSAIAAVLGSLILVVAFWGIKCTKNMKNRLKPTQDDSDLTLLDFTAIVNATNNFSESNLIGAGGFGSVYKGYLFGDREVAVKRLSKGSGQGVEEFMNEALLIARLQHRNLVGMIGCCIEGQERILVYEYMPNKSLDYFIFDHDRSHLLTWEKRFDIIVGIARGLLYLHQDSKLQVIHRDIKTSNILLDRDLNPKISDFGLARIFGGSDKEARTRRIVGTYGYMSPEYAFDGKFSIKSDVFSFGVLLLEIVSGWRNRGFSHPDHHHSLLGHAWLLWREGRAPEFMHETLHDSALQSQSERCMHVGLLCVQKFPEDRPSMASVVFMLANEWTVLPEPKQPGFFLERSLKTTPDQTSAGQLSLHMEGVLTMTMPQGR